MNRETACAVSPCTFAQLPIKGLVERRTGYRQPDFHLPKVKAPGAQEKKFLGPRGPGRRRPAFHYGAVVVTTFISEDTHSTFLVWVSEIQPCLAEKPSLPNSGPTRPLTWQTLSWTRPAAGGDGLPEGLGGPSEGQLGARCGAFLPEASCANGVESTLAVLGLCLGGFSSPHHL